LCVKCKCFVVIGYRGNIPVVSQDRHAGCEQLDGASDIGLTSGKYTLLVDGTRPGNKSSRARAVSEAALTGRRALPKGTEIGR
jgi:hypothetical protein